LIPALPRYQYKYFCQACYAESGTPDFQRVFRSTKSHYPADQNHEKIKCLSDDGHLGFEAHIIVLQLEA